MIKMKIFLRRMLRATVSFAAVALVSWAGLVAFVYNVDCISGDKSSVFEVPNKFSVELYCPAVSEEV